MLSFGLQLDNPNSYVVFGIRFFEALVVIGVIVRIVYYGLSHGLEEGLGKMFMKIRKLLWVMILTLSVGEILAVVVSVFE